MTGSQTTCFGLIRHATTLWNEQKIIQGQQDSQLAEAGCRMAISWGQTLAPFSWQRIICSDLGRTRETAELVNQELNVPIHHDKRLREQDWGSWTGMTLAHVKTEHKQLLKSMVRSGWLFQPPGGESREQVLKRSLNALHDAHITWPGESILIVCHEGVIKCLLYHLTNRQFLPEEPQLLKSRHLHMIKQIGHQLSIKKINHQRL